ncbi:hypothetical protein BDN70DRAFT_881443 [Pholiota conissans]|uniref:Transmembrane protein n=1 Tax=Pholiota conissans TaxID=109636 RepID=A0A9P5YZ81_9AGAR|nr:hypothetical protein BDN70DRAFT_881443 [Pholiota conissans]
MSRVPQIRIVDSEPEASLHPLAIWNHWRKYVIWDPRTYYGILEFSMLLVCILSLQATREHGGVQRLCNGLLLLTTISPLHWYSNHRSSRHFLTRSSSHFMILMVLGLITFGSQLTINLMYKTSCNSFQNCDTIFYPNVILWISVPILFFAAYLIYSAARNPPKDPLLAELPSPVDTDYEQGRLPWTSANVADGIEDDSPEEEGVVRL